MFCLTTEEGDEDDDDDDIVVGGATQDYRCPITLTLLRDPVTTYVSPLSPFRCSPHSHDTFMLTYELPQQELPTLLLERAYPQHV